MEVELRPPGDRGADKVRPARTACMERGSDVIAITVYIDAARKQGRMQLSMR